MMKPSDGQRRQSTEGNSQKTAKNQKPPMQRQAYIRTPKPPRMTKTKKFRNRRHQPLEITDQKATRAEDGVVEPEEGQKINMKIKIVETAGPSLASMLTKPKLGGCIFPDCDFEDNGVDHLRRGANYTGACTVDPCEDRYRGESGFGGHARIDGRGGHKDDIRLQNQKNSAAQHLRQKHPERKGDPTAIKFTVTKTNKKPLERVCREAVQIVADPPDKRINGRGEFRRPAIRQMQFGDLIPDPDYI